MVMVHTVKLGVLAIIPALLQDEFLDLLILDMLVFFDIVMP